MLISVDIGDLDEAIKSLEKIFDLKPKKGIDEQILEVLLKKVIEMAKENKNLGIKKKLMEIMARISSKQTLNFKVFFIRFFIKIFS